MAYESELAFATDLAREAGDIMRKYFRSADIGTEWKEDATPVTVADTTINQLVIDAVKRAFPEHGVIGEEGSYESEREQVWIVDPVDGTVPYSLGIPVSSFLLALVNKHDGQPVLGVTYEPYLDEMYTAVRGEGAFLNGATIETSKTGSLTKTYAALYGPAVQTEAVDYAPGRTIDELYERGCNGFRMASGAYTGARIATGQFASLVMGNGKPWDSASIAILVQEAGGVATDLEGNPRRYDKTELGCVISANPEVHEQILKLVSGKA
jgi:myo-inositol-1(or 4)-monophosphatase